MTKVKIMGAGSIGNHLANAARTKGWDVTLCDIDPDALERTRVEIYPSRYGVWDECIKLCVTGDEPRGGFDWIFIGTPPDSHVELALKAVEETPRGILVEKPVATPDLKDCQVLYEKAAKAGVRVFVGYDHVVAHSTTRFTTAACLIHEPQTLDVSFREHWAGIFNAHPWLSGPADTYLGYWMRGGGACGEHSHALNLWQHVAREIGAGRVTEVIASMDYVKIGRAEYDRIAMLNLRTEQGLLGRVVQDVVTRPPLKVARLQGATAAVEWQSIASPYQDILRHVDGSKKEEVFGKTRPDDFIQELDHLEHVSAEGKPSPISIERGLDSMLVITAAHLSAQYGSAVTIDYRKGYTRGALLPRKMGRPS